MCVRMTHALLPVDWAFVESTTPSRANRTQARRTTGATSRRTVTTSTGTRSHADCTIIGCDVGRGCFHQRMARAHRSNWHCAGMYAKNDTRQSGCCFTCRARQRCPQPRTHHRRNSLRTLTLALPRILLRRFKTVPRKSSSYVLLWLLGSNLLCACSYRVVRGRQLAGCKCWPNKRKRAAR